MNIPATFFFIIVLFFSSCNSIEKKHIKDINQNILAYIDSIPIADSEIDNLNRQELYDELCRIYLIRKVTLEQVIKDKILQMEAQKVNSTIEELKSKLYKGLITGTNLERFAKSTNYHSKVPELRETLIFHDIKSTKGHELLITRYKDYLLNQYVDSLKKSHKIIISLEPPKSPSIKLDNLVVHYKGNLNSTVSFLVISDFDCSMCREHNDFFEKLCAKYKDKVRFGFTHYSSYVSNSAIASECASNQGKFWEMHDSIFNAKLVPDSVALFRMARNLKLEMNIFGNTYKNKATSEKIMNNILKLESAGIYGTPTIMINNQLVFNSTSLNEIEKMLKDEIEKVD